MKNRLRNVMLTGVLFAAFAVPVIADIAPPPDATQEERQQWEQARQRNNRERFQRNKAERKAERVEPTSPLPERKKGCGLLGFADLTVFGIVIFAGLQLRRISKKSGNASPDDHV